jgi:hypothetical protein
MEGRGGPAQPRRHDQPGRHTDGLAMARGVSREWSGHLLGGPMQHMADKVGPNWSRPEPRELSLIGSLARRLRGQ